MKFNRPTFSEAIIRVRERRADRRNRVITNFMQAVVAASIIASTVYAVHSHIKYNAPTWAEFVNDGSIKETVVQFNADGVPNTLNINGERWDVVRVNAFNDAMEKNDGELFRGVQAQTYCNYKMIAYIAVESSSTLRNNLWHEVMHAGACMHGGDTYWNSINPTKDTHDGVKHLGEFLGNFAMANPEFVRWAGR